MIRQTISYERVQTILSRLTSAGESWQETARATREIDPNLIQPGDDRCRDTCQLVREVIRPDRAGHASRYWSTLYRDESGAWCATGWSDASKQRVFRPLSVVFDPDTGVYVSTDRDDG